MKKRILISVILALVLGAFALPTHAQTDTARLRLIHAVANTTAVDFYIDGTLAAGNVAFGGASQHIAVTAGAHKIDVRLAGTPAADPAVFSQDITVEPTLAYSWVLQGDPAALQPVLYEDILDSLDLGFSRVAIFHAAPAAPTVDIVRADIDFPVVTGVTYAVPYGTLNFPVGAYDLVVAPTGGTTADAIAQIGKVNFRHGVYYTLVVAPNNDDPTQASGFVLETSVNPAAETTLTRFAHAAADAPAVDVYLNEVLVITNLALGELSPHVGLPVGDHEMALRGAGSAPNSDPVFTQTITVGTDPQTLAITAGAEGLTVTALTDAAAGITSTQAQVQVLNFSNSPVDFALDETVLAEGLAPLSAGEGVALAPGTYPLGGGDKTLLGGTLYSLIFFDSAVVVAETPLAVGLDSFPGTVEVAAAETPVAEATEELAAATEEPVAEATEEVAAATEEVSEIAAQPTATPQVIVVTATPDPNLPTPTPIIIVVTATPDTAVQQALPSPVAPIATQPPAVVATTAPVAPGGSLVTALCSSGDIVCGTVNIAQTANLLCREYPSTNALVLANIPNRTEMILDGVAGPRDETGEIGVTFAIVVEGLTDFTELAGPDFAVANYDEAFLTALQISNFWLRVRYEPQPGALFGCWVRADYVQIRYLSKNFDEAIELLDLIDSGAWEIVPYNVPGGPIEASPQEIQGAAVPVNPVAQATPTVAAPVSTTPQVEGRLITSPGQTLNLRAEPKSDGIIRFAIPSETNGRPTVLVVIGRNEVGDWLKVIYASPTGNIEGWVASDFVQLTFNGQPYERNTLPVTP